MKNKGLKKGILSGLIALFLLFSFGVKAQSLTGTRGLIKAPTARMYESGTLAIGMGYVPAKFFKRTFNDWYGREQLQGVRTGNAGLTTFITVNPLPFMELMFRYTHELNMRVNPQTTYFPDRMFTARFKLLNERKNIPAIVLGLQDISELLVLTTGGSNFSSAYFVGSKNFNIGNFNIDSSLGYAFGFKNFPARDFKGFFGGVELKYDQFEKAQLLIDYDTISLNFGLQGFLFNRIHTVLGIMDFEPMFILAYRYKI